MFLWMRCVLWSGLLLGLLAAGVQASSLPEEGSPEAHWQRLLQDTQAAALERQLAEEARLQLTRDARDAQAKALHEARQQEAEAEARRTTLEAEQQQLEATLAELQQQMQRRSAAFGEVFAVYREAKGHFYTFLEAARFTLQNPEWLAAFRPDATEVPDIAALEHLWQGLQAAWIASAQAVSFDAAWVDAQGRRQQGPLVRLGDLQLLNTQGLLRFEGATQPPVLWPRQPRKIQEEAAAYVSAAARTAPFDPMRGLTLELYNHQPRLIERLQQGGWVGYFILFLGTLGLLIALVQSLRLLAEGRRLRQQLRQPDTPDTGNALGRVLAGLRRETVSATSHPEALEARLDELLLREAGALERGLSWVKLLAAIAPLLGLLGTVTGMIATFQAITLFGTSDPALMASGIAQALMTTVLGLVTAVPLLLAHQVLQGRSRYLVRTLEAETSAWLASRLAAATQLRDEASDGTT